MMQYIEFVQCGEPLTVRTSDVALIMDSGEHCAIMTVAGGGFRADGETVVSLLAKHPEAFRRFHLTRYFFEKGSERKNVAFNLDNVCSIGVSWVCGQWRPVIAAPGRGAPAADISYDEARALVGLPPSQIPLPDPPAEDENEKDSDSGNPLAALMRAMRE